MFPVTPIPPPLGGSCSFSPFDVDLGVFPVEAFRPDRSEGVDPVVFSL